MSQTPERRTAPAEAYVAPLPADVKDELFGSLARIRSDVYTNVDKTFIARTSLRRVEIAPPDAHVETLETLYNNSNVNCTEVVRTIVTDAPTEFVHLKFSAEITFLDEEPFPAVIRHEDSKDRRLFRVALGFRGRVVPPKGQVIVHTQCVIPASVMRTEDYWVFPFLYSHPADQMTIEAAFERDPADVHLFRDEYDAAAGAHMLKPIDLPQRRIVLRDDGGHRVVYRISLLGASGTHLFTWSLSVGGDHVADLDPPMNGVPPHTPPAPPGGSLLPALNPYTVLREAIVAVPAVKWALGVAGVAAGAAIVAQFFSTPGDAIVGTVVMLIMMVLLVVFAAVAGSSGAGFVTYPAMFFTWAMMLLFVGTVALVFLSVFFKYPIPYPELVGQFSPVATSARPETKTPEGQAPPATVTPAPPAGSTKPDPAQKLPARQPGTSAPRPQSLLAELRGTWEIVTTGDVNNVRVRRGTFQFAPQPDGEALVDANFVADGMACVLKGRASVAEPRVFLTFDATTKEGGSWSGKASFERAGQGRLSGRIEVKNGDDVSIQVRKIAR